MTATVKLFADRMGGVATSSFIGRKGDIFYNRDTGSLRISDGATVGGKSLTASGYGCFHKTANITAPLANTVYPFDWYNDATAHVNNLGVTVASANPTRLNLADAGAYKVFVEMQIKSTVNSNRETYIWVAKNGVDIAQTCVKIEIKQGGGIDAYQLLAKQWLLDNISANDYLEIRFAVSDVSGISLEYTPSQTTPYVRPAIPSAIVTVTRI